VSLPFPSLHKERIVILTSVKMHRLLSFKPKCCHENVMENQNKTISVINCLEKFTYFKYIETSCNHVHHL
jgi:hypothetical protein